MDDEAERAAVGRIGVARPKGAKPIVVDDLTPSLEKQIQKFENGQALKPGRPPKSPEASAFSIFSSCLKQIKTLDKTTQREVLSLLNELL